MLAIDAGVITVTLDRPDRGNALSSALVQAISEGLERAAADADMHTLVLRGEGRHFCTGFDLSTLDEETDSDLLARFVQIELLLGELWHAPVRTVAIAQGHVVGAGADLFTACDVRLAAQGAQFRFPGAGFGIVLGTRRLSERVGVHLALAWTSEGTSISLDEALQTGLASGSSDEVAPHVLDRPPVDRAIWCALRAAARPDRRDSDLAALVRSASRPGLKARMAAHRDRARASVRRSG